MAYRGFTAALPVGQQGFTGTQNPSQAQPGHLTYTDGAELDGGIIRKEGGAIKLNSAALGSGSVVIAGISWIPTVGTEQTIVFLSNGSILADTGAGTFATTWETGLNAPRDPPPWFLPCGGESVGSGRKMFVFSSTNQVHVALSPWTSTAPITNPAADWSASFPTFGVLHDFRVWAGGNASDPHRIYYSDTANHQNFTGGTSGTIAVYPGEGDRIVGAVSVRGALIVFKYPSGIYIIDTSGSVRSSWTVRPLTRAVGTVSQNTILQIENDILYMDRVGNIHSLGATNEFGDINSSNIGDFSDIPSFMRSTANLASLQRAQAVWYQAKRQAWFAVPTTGMTEPNLRLILGFQDPTPQGVPAPRFFMSRRDICSSLWLRPSSNGLPKPAFGDNAGFVWLGDQDTRGKDGVEYPIVFETAATDLSFVDPQLATRAKGGQFLELVFEPRGDWDLTVEVHWDDVLASIVTFDMGSGGAALGSFILDTDVLAASVVRSRRRRIAGSGRRVKLVASNTGLNQDVSIAGFYLSFTLMDERDG